MKNTKIKTFSFLFLIIFSADVYSQLLAPKRSGGDGFPNGVTCRTSFSLSTFCTTFTLPIEGLTFDESNPDESGALPVNNFGCDLHIGLIFEETGDASYLSITDAIVEEIRNEDYPKICIAFPLTSAMCADGELEFMLNLFCKDENGEFTPLSIVAATDPDESDWASVFGDPDGTPKALINGERFTTDICCEDPEPQIPDPTPLIGQNEDGSTVFIRNFEDISKVTLSVLDTQNQSVDISNRVSMTSSNECSVDLSNLNPGVYFVRAIENAIVYSKTIVKL